MTDCPELDELIPTMDEHGLVVMAIDGTEYFPKFSYSIGLTRNFEHPEVICFGLPEDLAHVAINIVADKLKAGEGIDTTRLYDDIFEGMEVRFLPVDKRNLGDYFGYAMRLYDGEFTALQLVWQDGQGEFPWQDGYDDNLKFVQPLLDRNADFKFYEEKNLGVYVSKSFFENDLPVLKVIHDAEGDWQFLSDDKTAEEDIMLVALEQVVLKAPELNELHYLDYGEMVMRKHADDIWREQPYTE